MKTYLAKRTSGATVGFIPTDQPGIEYIGRLGDGECVLAEILKPRSIKWHRRYFAICAQIGANQDPRRDADSIDHELRILAGHYDVLPIHDTDYQVRTPKRIAFNKLTHDGWAELWPSLEQAGIERFGAQYWVEV